MTRDSRLRDFFTRAVRSPHAPPQASYPPAVQRALFWYDRLTDWQRIQYAGIASLFTREFYAAVRSRLSTGGVFLQWVQAYEVDERTIATMDHSIPTTSRSLTGFDEMAANQVRTLAANCADFGVPLYDLNSTKQGIVHVIGRQ